MDSETLVERVVAHLQENPGFFRPRDLAEKIGAESEKVRMTLHYLWEQGRIDRMRVLPPTRRQPIGLYGVLDGVRPRMYTPWQGTAQTIETDQHLERV